MASASCKACAGTINNTGYPDAKPFGITKGKGLMRRVADDGTPNYIDPNSATLEADILAAVNNPDPSKRLYLLTNINNSLVTEADPTFATTDLNERFLTSQGITNVTFEIWGVTEQFYDKVRNINCQDFGEMEIDECGNLKGQLEADGFIHPRPVNKRSYKAKFNPAVAGTPSNVQFNYDYEYVTHDGNQWQIAAAAFGANNPLELKSLIDVNLAITVDSATQLTIVADFDYGYINSKKPWLGALAADFTANNLTTPAVISITSLTPTATDGEYTMVIPAQTTSDACTLKAFKSGSTIVNGYESAVTAFTAA